ncbi:ABC transporter permease [Seohaeicola zhoushanensis]
MRLGRLSALSQEQIVLGMAVVLFAVFALSIDGFLTAGNILSVIQNVSVLGILGAGMAMSIIGRGIDLSVVSVMAYSVAWTLSAFNQDVNLYLALLMGFGFALAVGLINGILIAYIEIPAIFATLASGTAVAGFGQYFLVDTDVVFVSDAVGRLMSIGSGRTLGVPNSVISLAIVAGFSTGSCTAPSSAATCSPWATTPAPPGSPASRSAR